VFIVSVCGNYSLLPYQWAELYAVTSFVSKAYLVCNCFSLLSLFLKDTEVGLCDLHAVSVYVCVNSPIIV
jgi:hypothetical protein